MTSPRLTGREAILVVSVFACFVSFSHAQTETATIYGSVTDPTAAVVASATVRLIDIDRGIQNQVATGSSGFYTFASVRPGHYRMEVERTGFKLARLTGITINVQDNLERNSNSTSAPPLRPSPSKLMP